MSATQLLQFGSEGVLKIFSKRDEAMNDFDGGVCRPAKPGLLNLKALAKCGKPKPSAGCRSWTCTAGRDFQQ